MVLAISELLLTDDLTILLGLISAALFIIRTVYRPSPLVHPILLGRQSDVARARQPGETAVYRNYSAGSMARLLTKPNKDVTFLADLVNLDNDVPRTLWSTKITNANLMKRAHAFGTALVRTLELTAHDSNVLILLNDSIEYLISDLALSTHFIPSFTISSLRLLIPIIESNPTSAIITSTEFLPHLLEVIHEANEHGHHHVIVVGELDANHAAEGQINWHSFAALEAEGANAEAPARAPGAHEVFSVSFFESVAGELHGAQLTHENLTAGVVAARVMLPNTLGLSSQDTIVSSHSLSTAYGRAIAYLAIHEGTNFVTLDSTKLLETDKDVPNYGVVDVASSTNYPVPSPTILFITPMHLRSLTSAIMQQARSSFLLFQFAWRHKVAGIREGFVTKESLWDRLVFDSARAKVVGEGAGTIRCVVISGGSLDAKFVEPARVAFSVPIINALSHPLVAGPVFGSHPFDLQSFPATSDRFGDIAHVGAPCVNVEAKLVGVDDDAFERGSDPTGTLYVRGPPVGRFVGAGTYEEKEDEENWVGTGQLARVSRNGSFKVLPATQ